MKRFWHNNNLTIVLFSIFFATIIGMSFAGWSTAKSEAMDHSGRQETYGEYLTSGDFIEGIFENWESEFLQMWALVVLTIFLRQKGSDESKPIKRKIPQDTTSRFRFSTAPDWSGRLRAVGHHIYAHSLSLVLLMLFLFSFWIHAVGGSGAYNQEAFRHGQPTVSILGYVSTSQFWYESLQNWQSEFLAVGTLILLSIRLRERGSPESKPVGVRYNASTGK